MSTNMRITKVSYVFKAKNINYIPFFIVKI